MVFPIVSVPLTLNFLREARSFHHSPVNAGFTRSTWADPSLCATPRLENVGCLQLKPEVKSLPLVLGGSASKSFTLPARAAVDVVACSSGTAARCAALC